MHLYLGAAAWVRAIGGQWILQCVTEKRMEPQNELRD